MSTITIRIDESLKTQAYAALDRLGVSPSEVLRQTLAYVAQSGKLPFQQTVLTPDEKALLAVVKERLANPQVVNISLDDL